jgi:prepilin-type N-terminal cleavage/methylation domain-containing protein
MTMRVPKRSERGFTLIEAVVTIVLLGILAALAAPMLVAGARAFDATTTGLGTLSNLRYATERIARELREVQYTGGAFSFGVGGMGATSATFTKGNGTTVTITRAIPNVTLQYSAGPAVTAVLTDQVSDLQFAYYQRDGVTAATGNGNVAIVQVTLTLNNPVTGVYVQRTRVTLRNGA